jgi:hypothetical protein
MDEAGLMTSWVVISLKEGDAAGSVADLSLSISGKIKLELNGVTDL